MEEDKKAKIGLLIYTIITIAFTSVACYQRQYIGTVDPILLLITGILLLIPVFGILLGVIVFICTS